MCFFFFLSNSSVNTTVWMHDVNANGTHEEKARWELHKRYTYCFEQTFETAPEKTAAVWPLPPISQTIKVK